MRTTIEIPDELYRTLKARAGLTGITMRQLVQRLIEQSLCSPAVVPRARKTAPPVIVPARGIPIRALTRAKLRRIEEEEDEANYAGSA
jgi:hypothetical protein